MVEKLVEQIEERFAELERQMADPEVVGDRERYAEVGRAYHALEPAHRLAREFRAAAGDADGAREILSEDGDDPEVREMLETAQSRLDELAEEYRSATGDADGAREILSEDGDDSEVRQMLDTAQARLAELEEESVSVLKPRRSA